MSTDRNLLFGVLALQADFLDTRQFAAVCSEWAGRKDTPLADLLVERGWLTDEDRAHVGYLLQRRLKKHGGDARASLAAVANPEVLSVLESVADADLHATLARVSVDPYATRPPSAGTPTSLGLRFRILRPHAEGGLGKVFVAHDEELHREVALKEIHNQHADHPESRARFLLEAEVTGGLEHPGIVPVYGLGHYPDGRPYYAMRFIRGDSLQDAIARFHKEKQARPAAERLLRLRQLLGRFVDVCQAVAYAHSRGVLHRDLKPGNVMLGKYGETLLVDWGLAKPLGRAAVPSGSEESPLRPASASGSAATQLGSALGTPQYMSPEQAAGRLDQLSPASDVYSLGATLYCLLTGRAPFAGGTVGEVLSRVQKGDFPPPRQAEPRAPAALEAVCLKAMAMRPGDRYRSAQALAQDVEGWLADEPVSAWREPLRLRAGRWARRHQTAVTATAAAVLVALLLGGGGAFLFERQRAERRAEQARQEAQLRQGVEAALAEVVRLQGQARWGEARAVLSQAASRLGEEGPEDLRARVERARGDLDLVARLDDIRLSKATWFQGHFDFEGVDRTYAAVFAEAGLAKEGDDPAEAAGRVQVSAVRGSLVGALDDWAAFTPDARRRAWLLEVAQKADPNRWSDRARQRALWGDRAALEGLTAQEEAAEQSPELVVALAERLALLGRRAVGLLRRAQARYPNDFWLNFELGNQVRRDGSPEAVAYYRAALALRPDTAAVHNNLGIVLSDLGRRREAEEEVRTAIRLDPRHPSFHSGLGYVRHAQGKLQEAEEAYRAALRLDPKYAGAHNGLGNVLSDRGKPKEAKEEYRAAIFLDPKFAPPHNGLGSVLVQQGKGEEAEREYRAAIGLDPKAAPPHYNLGILLKDRGRLEEAKKEYLQALGLGLQAAGERLRQCDRLLALVQRLPAVLRGDGRPANAQEMLGFAELCSQPFERRLAAAARFYGDAFAADPKLADDLKAGHRYNAACYAALAGCGQGKDADKLDDRDKTRLRRLALDWLKADLTLRAKQSQSDRVVVQQTLRHWKVDADLAGVRGDALAKLPEAEREPWKKLWDEVDGLLAKVGAEGKKQ
jgi:serine/threonine protein kinase/Flp pilus assembly protein TadD